MSILLIALTGFISQRLVQRHAVGPYLAALRTPPPHPDPDSSNGPYGPVDIETLIGSAQRGRHHLSVEIHYPGMPRERTLKVGVAMISASFSKIIARQQIEQVIDWPDYPTWQVDELLAKATPEQNLKRATELIDAANDDESDPYLQQARASLEKLGDSPLLEALGGDGAGT
jgi:hypothetical protein